MVLVFGANVIPSKNGLCFYFMECNLVLDKDLVQEA